MALNTFKCNYLTPLHFKGLNGFVFCATTAEKTIRLRWRVNVFSTLSDTPRSLIGQFCTALPTSRLEPVEQSDGGLVGKYYWDVGRSVGVAARVRGNGLTSFPGRAMRCQLAGCYSSPSVVDFCSKMLLAVFARVRQLAVLFVYTQKKTKLSSISQAANLTTGYCHFDKARLWLQHLSACVEAADGNYDSWADYTHLYYVEFTLRKLSNVTQSVVAPFLCEG